MLGCCRLTRTDGPDRFIRDGEGAQRLRGKAGQPVVQLLGQHVVGRTVVSFCKCFTDTEDGAQPVVERGSDFLLDQVSLFAKERSPL